MLAKEVEKVMRQRGETLGKKTAEDGGEYIVVFVLLFFDDFCLPILVLFKNYCIHVVLCVDVFFVIFVFRVLCVVSFWVCFRYICL